MNHSSVIVVLIAGLFIASCASNKSAEFGTVNEIRYGDAKRIDDHVTFNKKGIAYPKSGTVTKLIATDEFLLDNRWHVRLAGIDAPVADPEKRIGDFYGRKGLEKVTTLLLNRKIKIDYGNTIHDASGRIQGYVTTKDNIYLNLYLVENGYALAACRPPNRRDCNKFSEAQKLAVQAKVGLWTPDTESKHKSARRIRRETTKDNVKSILDGDTIMLEDNRIVRLIGIDAPEEEQMYQRGSIAERAYEFLIKNVDGKAIELEYDIELLDPRGRDLAYVYINYDDQRVMLNKLLVQKGLAWVAIFPPNILHAADLLAAQADAVKRGSGIWHSSPESK